MSQTADFSDMISSFSVPGVTRLTYVNGYYGDDGRYIIGNVVSMPIVASMQQPTGAQLQLLPEGQRVEDSIVVYTSSPLNTANTPGGEKADRIQYQGFTFEVQSQMDWTANGNFTGAICKRVDV